MEITSTDSGSRLEKLAEKAAARAMKKQKVKEEVDIPDDFSQEDVSNLLSSPLEGDASDPFAEMVGFDIFDHCDRLQKTQGHQISYVVKRNGEMLTVKYHPYTWEQLQKEFGAGQYQIIAKSITSKRYLKMETRVVADRQGNIEQGVPKEKESTGMEFDKLILLMQQQRETDRREMKEALERQKIEEERRRSEEKERAKETIAQAQTQSLMMVEMMKIMSDKAEKSTVELARIQQAAEERAARAQENQMSLMMQLFQTQLQNQKPKEDSISPIELMKITKEAEEAGFNKMLQLMNLARAEAEERMSLRGDGGEPREKKSLTDTLIESMIPTITSALAPNMGVRQVPVPQQRRQLPPNQARPRQLGQKAGFSQPTKASEQSKAVQGSLNRGPKPVEKGSLGLPTIKFKKPAADSSKTENLPSKELIEEWLSPVITDSLLNSIPAKEAAPKVIEVVKKHGLSNKQFCNIMTIDHLSGLVTKYGLPEIAFDWFKELHAHISSQP